MARPTTETPPLERAGPYRLGRKLGQGAMGAVYEATHIELGSPAAVKLVASPGDTEAEARARFRREAQALASLRSNHVVQLLDFGFEQGIPYLAMERLEGESLAALLDRRTRLSLVETLDILTQVGRALRLAHERGIVHRDLKPENVFLTRESDQRVVKVLDFGLARVAQQVGLGLDNGIRTATGTFLGTPHYASPEQITGLHPVDHGADIWALGVIAHQCVTGFLPFTGPTIGHVLRQICSSSRPVPSERYPVPATFDEWFERSVAPERTARFGSVAEQLRRFETLVESNCSSPLFSEAPVALSAPADSPALTRPWVAMGVGLGLAVAGAWLAAAWPGLMPTVSPREAGTRQAGSQQPSDNASAGSAPATVVSLEVTTQPKDAQVFLDGNFIGSGIVRHTLEPSDTHHLIEVRRGGFRPFARRITVDRPRAFDVHLSRDPVSGASTPVAGGAEVEPRGRGLDPENPYAGR